MKRLFDVVSSLAALVVLSPLLLAICLAIRVTSPGPVIYRGKRAGRKGVPFTIMKFRTMRHGGGGAGITRAGDTRVTPLGRFLRRYKLDELPQLVNVVRGEMSLVGPRPEAEEYVSLYSEEERRVLEARPGLTSAASLRYRDEERLLTGDDWRQQYVDQVMRDKLREDLAYLERRTFITDLALIFRTLRVFVTSRGDRGTAGEEPQSPDRAPRAGDPPDKRG